MAPQRQSQSLKTSTSACRFFSNRCGRVHMRVCGWGQRCAQKIGLKKKRLAAACAHVRVCRRARTCAPTRVHVWERICASIRAFVHFYESACVHTRSIWLAKCMHAGTYAHMRMTHAQMHARPSARPPARPPARTPAHTHARTAPAIWTVKVRFFVCRLDHAAKASCGMMRHDEPESNRPCRRHRSGIAVAATDGEANGRRDDVADFGLRSEQAIGSKGFGGRSPDGLPPTASATAYADGLRRRPTPAPCVQTSPSAIRVRL